MREEKWKERAEKAEARVRRLEEILKPEIDDHERKQQEAVRMRVVGSYHPCGCKVCSAYRRCS